MDNLRKQIKEDYIIDKMFESFEDFVKAIDAEIIKTIAHNCRTENMTKPFDLIIGQKDIPYKLTAAEAVYGFAGWLTSRDKTIVMSGSHDAAPAARAVREFLEANDLGDPSREDWYKFLKHPKAEKPPKPFGFFGGCDFGEDVSIKLGCYGETGRLERLARVYNNILDLADTARAAKSLATELVGLYDYKGTLEVTWASEAGFNTFHSLVEDAWKIENETLWTHIMEDASILASKWISY